MVSDKLIIFLKDMSIDELKEVTELFMRDVPDYYRKAQRCLD